MFYLSKMCVDQLGFRYGLTTHHPTSLRLLLSLFHWRRLRRELVVLVAHHLASVTGYIPNLTWRHFLRPLPQKSHVQT